MEQTRLTIRYDPVADEFNLDTVPRYVGQISDEIEPGVIVRSNPRTGEIESLDILDFIHRCGQGDPIELPLGVRLGNLAQILKTA